jgi:hypothetical protein
VHASRAALLTGQAVHRLEEGANLHAYLPKRFDVYPDLLERAGYVVGYTGKGWGPGRLEPGGRDRNPAGPQFRNFDEFIERRPQGRPFLFWFGSNDPHRPYEPGSGAKSGMKTETVKVPAFLPDTPEVRSDLLDYYFEVQRFDRDLGASMMDDGCPFLISHTLMRGPLAIASGANHGCMKTWRLDASSE